MRYAQGVLLALIVSFALPGPSRADQQRDPELKELLQKIIGSADCFTDKYESEVWYKSMEPRLAQFVPTHAERLEILDLETYMIERPSLRSDRWGVGFSKRQVHSWQVVGVVRSPLPWLGAKHLGIPGLDFLDGASARPRLRDKEMYVVERNGDRK